MGTAAELLAAKFNKDFGDERIILGSRLLEISPVSWLSTGSLALDVMYGGGLVRNQWNEIVGLESSGKSAALLKCIAHNQQQRKDFLTLWVAAEDLDPEWCELLGDDLSRMLVVQTNVMEEAYDACIKVIMDRAVDLVVIDSLPALVPLDEDEKDMGEFSIARGALLTGKFLRKAAHALKRAEGERPCTGVIINQWRDRVGVVRGDPRTTPGGKAKNYFFWTRTELSRVEWITKGKEKIGIAAKARTFKNKAAPVQREAEIDFYFDDGGPVAAGNFDTSKEILNVALAYEIVERRGNMYDFRGEAIAKGREALYAVMYEDPSLGEKIAADVLAKVRGDEPVQEATRAARKGVKRRQA